MCNIEHMVGGEGQTSQSDGISYSGNSGNDYSSMGYSPSSYSN